MKKEIERLHILKQRYIQRIHELDNMLRGSLTTLGTMCNRKDCECHRGKKHGTAFYLSKTEGGKTKMLYIPKEKLDVVKKGIESYREYKTIGKEICRINEEIIKLGKEEERK
jgi:hypothetical protein